MEPSLNQLAKEQGYEWGLKSVTSEVPALSSDPGSGGHQQT